MANVSKISGFKPVKHVTGAPYNGQANIYFVPATDATPIFVGDPVKLAADSNDAGYPQVTRATAGAAVLGVCVGVINTKLDPVSGKLTAGSISLDTPQYRPANVGQYILVADAPDILYEVEVGSSTGSANDFQPATVGLNADAYVANGSTSTGNSASQLNGQSAATTATLQFKIMGLSPVVGNEFGDYAKAIVKINNAQLSGGTGTAGV